MQIKAPQPFGGVDWQPTFQSMDSNDRVVRYFLVMPTKDFYSRKHPVFRPTAQQEYDDALRSLKSYVDKNRMKNKTAFKNLIKKQIEISQEKEIEFYTLWDKNLRTKNINLQNDFNELKWCTSNGKPVVQLLNNMINNILSSRTKNGQFLQILYKELGSTGIYEKLKNPIQSYFSRVQLAGGLGLNTKEAQAIGDKFLKGLYQEQKKGRNYIIEKINEDSQETLRKYVLDTKTELYKGIKSLLRNSKITTNEVYVPKGENYEKRALKTFIQQSVLPAAKNWKADTERSTKDFKITLPNKQTVDVKLKMSKTYFEMVNASTNNVIFRVGATFEMGSAAGKLISLEESKHNPDTWAELRTAFVDLLISYFEASDVESKTTIVKWLRSNGDNWLSKVIQQGQEDKILKVYNNAGLSGLLGELQASLLRYAGLGSTRITGADTLGGMQSHADVVTTLGNSQVGIQVKNYVTSAKEFTLYSDADITLASRAVLSKYYGEDVASAIQYLLVNQNVVSKMYDWRRIGEVGTDSEIKEMIEEAIPTGILNFLRIQSGNDTSGLKNLFFLLNGKLIPTSVILRNFLKTAQGKDIREQFPNLGKDLVFNTSQEDFYSKSSKIPKKVKNVVDAYCLKQARINFTGLHVDLNYISSL